MTDPARVAALASELSDVTIVVNNAGIARPAQPLTATLGDARAEMETNYLGLVTTTQAFARCSPATGGGLHQRAERGELGGGAGPRHLLGVEVGRLGRWTNAARLAVAPSGTQVVAVHVGFVDTDSTAGLDGEKVAPSTVATAALDALEAGDLEAVVDPRSREVRAALSGDLTRLYPQVPIDLAAAGH